MTMTSLSALSAMSTAQASGVGARLTTTARSILSSKPESQTPFSHGRRSLISPADQLAERSIERSRRSIAIARKMQMSAGAPLMSPGMSPGAPPSGYTNDKKGWLPPQGARAMGGVGCIAYPRENMRPKRQPLEPCAEQEWHQELEHYTSRPIGLGSDMIPQVQWRDAREYLSDAKDGTRFPLCTHLAL